MAEKKQITLDIAINNSNSASSIRELNQALKQLISLQSQVGANSKEFKKLQQAINETEGKIGDLTDSFSTLRGSGIERVNASMKLFREGFINADYDKVSIGLKGVGSALKALPIFLIVAGVKLLIDQFNNLKDSGGLIGETFTAITSVINRSIEALKNFTDQIGLTAFAAKNAGKQTLIRLKEEEINIKHRYDEEIRLAEAAGKSTKDLESAKASAVTKNLQAQRDEYKKLNEAININVLTSEEYLEKRKENDNEIKRLTKEIDTTLNDSTIAKIKNDKKEEQSEKEKREKREKLNKDISAQLKQDAAEGQREEDETTKRLDKELEDRLKATEEYIKNKNKAEADGYAQTAAIVQKETEDAIKAAQEKAKLEKDLASAKQKLRDLEIQAAKEVLNTLTTIFFEYNEARIREENANSEIAQHNLDVDLQNKLDSEYSNKEKLLNNDNLTAEERQAIEETSRKNEYEINKANTLAKFDLQLAEYKNEIELKKKAFNAQKAFSAAQTIITGVNAAINAFNSQLSVPTVDAPIRAAAAAAAVGVFTAAQVATILSKQFDPGSPPTPPVLPAYRPGGSSSADPRSLSQGFTNGIGTDANNLNANSGNVFGNQQIRAYVVESDITNSQETVNRIKRRSTL